MKAAARRNRGGGRNFAVNRHGFDLIDAPGNRLADRRNQGLRVGMRRALNHVIRRADFHDFAEIHDRDAIREIPRRREVVRDVEIRQAKFLLHGFHRVQDVRPRRKVNHGDRLVGDDDFRREDERSRRRHALPLPAAQHVRKAINELFRRRQAHGLQRLPDALLPLPARVADAMNQQRLFQHVFRAKTRIHGRIRVLKNHLHVPVIRFQSAARRMRDIFPLKPHRSAGRLKQFHDQLAGRGFAAAGFADKRQNFPVTQVKADAIHRFHPALLAGKHLPQIPPRRKPFAKLFHL